MSILIYVLFFFGFISAYSKGVSTQAEIFSTIYFVDMIGNYITILLFFGGVFLELVPFIYSKVNKGFQYSTYKNTRLSKGIIIIIYSLLFLIGAMFGFLGR